MSDKQTAKVVVVRCADLSSPTHAVDVRQCATCGENCWASKTTTDLESRYDVTYSCQVCTPADDLLQQHKVAFLESQRAEVEQNIGSWGVTLLCHQLGITEIDDS